MVTHNFAQLKLNFLEKPISAQKAILDCDLEGKKPLTEDQNKWWSKCKPGNSFSTVHPKGSWFNSIKLGPNKTSNTVCASASRSASGLYHWSEPRQFTPREYGRFQSFPDNYKCPISNLVYILGMSVPPYMMNRISKQVQLQWLDRQSNGQT